MVFLVAAVAQRDPDAGIVLAGGHADGGSGEFGGDLIEASGGEAAGRAGYPKGRDWGVVAGLFGEVGEADGLGGAGG